MNVFKTFDMFKPFYHHTSKAFELLHYICQSSENSQRRETLQTQHEWLQLCYIKCYYNQLGEMQYNIWPQLYMIKLLCQTHENSQWRKTICGIWEPCGNRVGAICFQRYGYHMIFTQDLCIIQMVFIWQPHSCFHYSFHIESRWLPHDYHMIPIQFLWRKRMGPMYWFSHGLFYTCNYMVARWRKNMRLPHGFHIDPIWDPHGNHMESI